MFIAILKSYCHCNDYVSVLNTIKFKYIKKNLMIVPCKNSKTVENAFLV